MKKLARWFQDFLKMSVAPAHNYSNSSQIAWTKTERRRLDVGGPLFILPLQPGLHRQHQLQEQRLLQILHLQHLNDLKECPI
jgi:hypothetical protein